MRIVFGCVCLFLCLAVRGGWTADGEWMYEAPDLPVVASSGGAASGDGLVDLPYAWPGLRVISQGGSGGQHDLSIRGSAFSGAGFSVEGLALPVAQTEHFNAELPLPAAFFGVPEVLSGYEQASGTEGHLVGTVNWLSREIGDVRRVSAGFGEGSSYRGEGFVSASEPFGAVGGGRAGAAFQAGGEESRGVDVQDNDSRMREVAGMGQWGLGGLRLNLLAGHRGKEFGARGFYGVNPSFPARETLRDTLVVVSGRRDERVGASVAWRRLDDDYRLELPGALYRNQHQTRLLTGQAGGVHEVGEGWRIRWRLSGTQEELASDSLGDHRRGRAAGSMLAGWERGAVRVEGGIRQEVFEREVPATLPQASATLLVVEDQQVVASYSASVRQPSYTELNYESPASLGNAGLERQLNEMIDLTWRRVGEALRVEAVVFSSRSRDAVDWVRETGESARWTAENIGSVTTRGVELRLLGRFGGRLELGGSAAYLDKDSSAAPYSSRYVLDYARFSGQVTGEWRIPGGCSVWVAQGFRRQAENRLRRDGDAFPGSVRVRVEVPRVEGVCFEVGVRNVWDDRFEEYPGQDTASGRRFDAGVSAVW